MDLLRLFTGSVSLYAVIPLAIWYMGKYVWKGSSITIPRPHPMYDAILLWVQAQLERSRFPGNELLEYQADTNSTTEIHPSFSAGYGIHCFIHGGWPFLWERRRASESSLDREEATLTALFWPSRGRVRNTIQQAFKFHNSQVGGSVNVYSFTPRSPSSKAYPSWEIYDKIPPRASDTIEMQTAEKELIINTAVSFFESKSWYLQKSVPWTKGFCFVGPPGTGKTSMIRILGTKCRKNIYKMQMSSKDMTTTDKDYLVSKIPERSIVAMEDIDSQHRGIYDSAGTEGGESAPAGGLSLASWLGNLDGLGSPGLLYILTMNSMNGLDEATKRRLIIFQFGLVGSEEAKNIYIRLYSEKDSDPVVEENASNFAKAIGDRKLSAASIQNHLMNHIHDKSAAVKSIHVIFDTRQIKERP